MGGEDQRDPGDEHGPEQMAAMGATLASPVAERAPRVPFKTLAGDLTARG
jgi:hypothetical protein